MARSGNAMTAAIVAAVLLLMARTSRAASVDVGEPVFSAGDETAIDLFPNTSDTDILGVGLPSFPYEGEVFMDTPSANVAAFLYMIRRAEHRANDVASGADYQTFYSGIPFSDMSEHPAITGEVAPIRLESSKCLRLGYKNGVCFSSAAGAYQFIKPTWIALRDQHPRLTDFSPASQDQAAIRLLEKIGALRLVRAGEIEKAIVLAGSQWASLPGSTAGQNPKSLQVALNYFTDGGGVA